VHRFYKVGILRCIDVPARLSRALAADARRRSVG
jgi:hypothetical protein